MFPWRLEHAQGSSCVLLGFTARLFSTCLAECAAHPSTWAWERARAQRIRGPKDTETELDVSSRRMFKLHTLGPYEVGAVSPFSDGEAPVPYGGSTLEATHGQILSQSPTDATRFWWHLYGS